MAAGANLRCRGGRRQAAPGRKTESGRWQIRAASGTHDTRSTGAPGNRRAAVRYHRGIQRFTEQEEKPVSEVNVSAVPQELSSQAAREARNGGPLRIALFGFGTVAGSVARILVESKPQGLELTHIYSRSLSRRRANWVPSSVTWSDDADAGAGLGCGCGGGAGRWA